MKVNLQAAFLVALSVLAFATTAAILTFYAPRDYGLFQLVSALWLSEKAAVVISTLLALLSGFLRLLPSPASTRRRQYMALSYLIVGALGVGGGIWILVESYASIADLRFDLTALTYAAISLVLSVWATSFAASLALLSPRSDLGLVQK